MLELFRRGSCSRRLYVAMLVFLCAFGFAQGPIERFLARGTETTLADIHAVQGMQIQKSFSELRGAVQTDASDGPTAERTSRERTQQFVETLQTQSVKMAAASVAAGGAHLAALVLLGLAVLVGTIWMVLARVRDIGWPIWVAFAVLSPKIVLRFFGGDMTEIQFQAIQYGFFAGLALLAFIPGGFGTGGVPARPVATERVPLARSGAFGKRA